MIYFYNYFDKNWHGGPELNLHHLATGLSPIRKRRKRLPTISCQIVLPNVYATTATILLTINPKYF